MGFRLGKWYSHRTSSKIICELLNKTKLYVNVIKWIGTKSMDLKNEYELVKQENYCRGLP